MVHLHVLRDFAKSDAQWLDPLIKAIAEHAPLLAEGKDSTYANRLHAAVSGVEEDETVSRETFAADTAERPKNTKASRAAAPPETGGALARGLRKLFGGKASDEQKS